MKQLLLLVVTMFLWASCSNQDEPVNQAPEAAESQTASRYLSPSEAVKRASEAYENMFGKGSRSTLSGRAYLYNASTGSRSFGTDSVLYVVNFDEGGFAVVPAYRYDDTEAYAIGEHSTFDASQNPAAAAYVDAVCDYALSRIDSLKQIIIIPQPGIIIPPGWSQGAPPYSDYLVRTERVDSTYDKSVVTKWGQGYPYNSFCPTVYDNTGNLVNAPAGCPAIAIGQICGYYRIPAQSLDGYSIHWNEILAKSNASYLNRLYQQEVAHLVRQIGSRAKFAYAYYGSGSNISYYYSALKELGYPNAKIDNSLTSCVNYVKTFGPCIVRSDNMNSNSGVGHCWVIDGVKVFIYNKYKALPNNLDEQTPISINEKTYIQCNWGEDGSGDGWYIAKDIKYSDAGISATGQSKWTIGDCHPSTGEFSALSMTYIINLK